VKRQVCRCHHALERMAATDWLRVRVHLAKATIRPVHRTARPFLFLGSMVHGGAHARGVPTRGIAAQTAFLAVADIAYRRANLETEQEQRPDAATDDLRPSPSPGGASRRQRLARCSPGIATSLPSSSWRSRLFVVARCAWPSGTFSEATVSTSSSSRQPTWATGQARSCTLLPPGTAVE
jgi:hypothetical protein